jgi:uncharacterized protein (DUF2267 family)
MRGSCLATNISSLDRAVQNAVLWLNDIQTELGWENREIVYKATKAVLQTIRDRLPVSELFHFSTNLPIVLKGMLFEGYDPSEAKKEKIKTIQEFYDRIQTHYDPLQRDIVSGHQAAFGVINVLFNRIGEGEMRKVADNMPLKLKPLFKQRSKPFSMQAAVDFEQAEVPQS